MDVLLIGGQSNMMNAIIDKLNKEGHRIYVLTGSRTKTVENKKVFEYYFFPYESSSLKEVFYSVNPDAVICMGAYDSSFDWTDIRKGSVRYSAGILNILMAFALHNKGRFIYLSSEAVYETTSLEDISEDTPTSAVSFKAMTLAQTEQVCEKYNTQMGLDIMILRLDNLCDLPGSIEAVTNIAEEMCLEALRTGSVSANEKHEFSLLYVSDAVEFIYKAMMVKQHKQIYYHLSSGEVVNELVIAQLIKNKLDGKIEIKNTTLEQAYRVVLSNHTFVHEMRAEVFYKAKDTIEAVINHMLANKAVFLGDKNSGSFGNRLKERVKRVLKVMVPYLENLILFIPFFMLNNRTTDSKYFANLDFYVLYVLLFATVHGQRQATISAILATAGYLFRQAYWRTGFEVLLDYNTYVWIAQLFIIGFVVGHMRDQIVALKAEGKQEVGYLKAQINDVEDINMSNSKMKNVLINQLVGQSDSLGRVYGITSKLDKYEPEEVLFYASKVLGEILKSDDVCIYTVANGSYARLHSYTSEKAKAMGNSIEFGSYGLMSEAIEKKNVYINRNFDEGMPLMARAVYEGDEPKIIIMVWSVPWDCLTMSEANMLTITSYLIHDAVLQGDRYLSALERERYFEGTKILEPDAFEKLTGAFITARKNALTECSLVKIVSDKPNKETAEDIGKKLRATDYMGCAKNGSFYALLANTDSATAKNVIGRFKEQGYECTIEEGIGE